MATRGFTPASGQDVFSIEQPEQLSSWSNGALTGREAKNFYENLIRDETGCQRERDRKSRRRRAREVRRVQPAGAPDPRRDAGGHGSQTERPANNTDRTVELQGLRLLRCAHNGDISGLKHLLSRGADVNFQVQQFFVVFF